jgi:hypothetical protein
MANYLANKAARRPKLRVYFEPFSATTEWWIVHLELKNRSENTLAFEQVRLLRPLRAKISTWLGGFAGTGSGGGPIHYDLPEEVLTAETTRKLTQLNADDSTLEIPPDYGSVHLTTLIVKMPSWSLSKHVVFRDPMFQMH